MPKPIEERVNVSTNYNAKAGRYESTVWFDPGGRKPLRQVGPAHGNQAAAYSWRRGFIAGWNEAQDEARVGIERATKKGVKKNA